MERVDLKKMQNSLCMLYLIRTELPGKWDFDHFITVSYSKSPNKHILYKIKTILKPQLSTKE